MLFSALLAWALLVSPQTETVGVGFISETADVVGNKDTIYGLFSTVRDHWAMILRYFELVAEQVQYLLPIPRLCNCGALLR